MKTNINDSPLRVYRSIPRYYEGRPNTINYNQLTESEHILDGWRDIIIPTYNTETQKLGSLIIVNDTVTYQVIDLTQEEIEQREQDELDNDLSAQYFNNRRNDGNQMFDRFLQYITRKYDNGNLTGNQVLTSFNLLYLPLLPLKDGMFEIVNANLNGITEPSNQKVLAILNLAKQKVSEYLNQS